MKTDLLGILFNLAGFALIGYFFFQAGRSWEMTNQVKEELKKLREQKTDRTDSDGPNGRED